MPTDGIVKETADQVTRGAGTDLDKVRAVYDWILATTYREPKVRGCGVGDIKAILETRNFGGKRRLRSPRGAVGLRLPLARGGEPQRHEGAALPRRGPPG
jgi:hypothetical protein